MVNLYTKNQKKVLLINPSSEFRAPVLPLGLASIAAYLKSNNIDVSVIDAWAEDMGFDELKNKVSESRADIIGVYVISSRYGRAKSTIEACRKALPDSVIIAGGPHPSSVPIETLKEIPQLDICTIGEGEITMCELAKSLQAKSNLSEVDGIAFRGKNKEEIIITKPRAFIKDLDSLPFPARELFPLEKYRAPLPHGRENPYFALITSRGCPFQCAYCSKDVFKDIYRTRSPKNVCDEVEELISKYNAREILFSDDDFSLNMQRAEEICDEILRRNLKFHWATSTRVDQVNEQLLRKMKKAGCWMVIYGVESGNQKVLDAINKRFTIEQTILAFEITKKVGLFTLCGFIIGLPGETRETVQDTCNLIKKIKPNFISGGILIVYPGSRLFRLIKEGKYQGKLRDLKKGENMPAFSLRETILSLRII